MAIFSSTTKAYWRDSPKPTSATPALTTSPTRRRCHEQAHRNGSPSLPTKATVRHPHRAEVNALGAMNTHAKGKRIFVYQCPACDGWHLTRSPHRYPESQLWPTKPAPHAPPPENSPSRRRASTDERSADNGSGGSMQR